MNERNMNSQYLQNRNSYDIAAAKRINKMSKTLRLFFVMLSVIAFTFFTFLHAVFSANNIQHIELASNKDTVNVGEAFLVTITVIIAADKVDAEQATIYIPGLEKFQQHGASNQTSLQYINGVSVLESKKIYKVSTASPGIYTIGPAMLKAGSQTNADDVVSNIITVAVEDDAVGGGVINSNSHFVQNKTNNANPSVTTEYVQRETKSDNDNYSILLWVIFFVSLVILLYLFFQKEKELLEQQKEQLLQTQEHNYIDAEEAQNQAKDVITQSKVNSYNKTGFSGDIAKLKSIKDKQFYSAVISFIGRYFTEKSNNPEYGYMDVHELKKVIRDLDLTPNEKKIIKEILHECDVGRYAPDTSAKHDIIISKLEELITNVNDN